MGITSPLRLFFIIRRIYGVWIPGFLLFATVLKRRCTNRDLVFPWMLMMRFFLAIIAMEKVKPMFLLPLVVSRGIEGSLKIGLGRDIEQISCKTNVKLIQSMTLWRQTEQES